jgi:hypothetical protein
MAVCLRFKERKMKRLLEWEIPNEEKIFKIIK